MKTTFKSSFAAIEEAIKEGRLSRDKNSPNYVGNYMYMGHGYHGEDCFKHIFTSAYLPNKEVK